jgi:hypothetical protein
MKGLAAVVALLPVGFAPHAGWHAGHGRENTCAGAAAARCVQVSTWTATVSWCDCSECLPHQTIESLPPDGIALQIPPRFGVYQRLARFGKTEGCVWAFFGRARPTRAQLAAANAELRTVQLR